MFLQALIQASPAVDVRPGSVHTVGQPIFLRHDRAGVIKNLLAGDEYCLELFAQGGDDLTALLHFAASDPGLLQKAGRKVPSAPA